MNNQVKLIEMIQRRIDELPTFNLMRYEKGKKDAYEEVIAMLIDTPPVPTIKPGDTHECPKCGEKNCFDTPLAESTALRFVWCSFCNQFSYKEDWR